MKTSHLFTTAIKASTLSIAIIAAMTLLSSCKQNQQQMKPIRKKRYWENHQR